MLEVEEIDVGYGDVQALWDVTLNANEGEIVALVGSNGAGKTTVLKAVSGSLRPKKGKVILDKEDRAGVKKASYKYKKKKSRQKKI